MGSISLMHEFVLLFIYLILYLIVGIPVARILQRTGRTGWWSVLAVIPLANLIGLWVFAFSRWPALDGGPRPTLWQGPIRGQPS